MNMRVDRKPSKSFAVCSTSYANIFWRLTFGGVVADAGLRASLSHVTAWPKALISTQRMWWTVRGESPPVPSRRPLERAVENAASILAVFSFASTVAPMSGLTLSGISRRSARGPSERPIA